MPIRLTCPTSKKVFVKNQLFEKGVSYRGRDFGAWNVFSVKQYFLDFRFRFFAKFLFLAKISIFGQNFYFWPNFIFLAKLYIFGQKFDFYPKFQFWTKFIFLTTISIFGQNFYFWPKFHLILKYFYQNLNFAFLLWFLDYLYICKWTIGLIYLHLFSKIFHKFLTKIKILAKQEKIDQNRNFGQK